MGQLSLIAVLAAFLLSGIVVYNANQSADRASDKVWEHQYHVIARDAASTGMASTTRRLAANIMTPWNGGLLSALTQANVAYDNGMYDVRATASANCPLLDAAQQTEALNGLPPDGDIITVIATGKLKAKLNAETDQRHQIRACYVKADYGLFAPPAFNYGFISEDQFTFNGGPTIQALVEGEGHIHSNNHMYLGPQVDVDGHATYTNSGESKTSDVASFGEGPSVPLEPFSAVKYATDNNIPDLCTSNPNRCLYQTGFSSSGNQVISPPSCGDSPHCADQPFIWYIDGDFTLSGSDHIRIPQYTTIVVNGNISVSGSSAVTVTGKNLQTYCKEALNRNNCNAQQEESVMRDWVRSQLFDGEHSPIAWYGAGNVDINGTSALVGNFYVNGDVTLNGGGGGNNTIGSFASATGDITANGGGNGNNFWFLEVAEKNVIPGVMLPGKQIVRIALAEWTDPVLKNSTP